MLDLIDQKLLNQLQENNQVSVAELGEVVGLSTAGVHKRLKKLREQGYFVKEVALLNRHQLGLDLLCFLKITFKQNLSPTNYTSLRKALTALPEVVECHALTGRDDALLKVLVKDHASLKDFLQRFASAQDCVGHVETSIVLEEIKATTALPLRQVPFQD